MAKLRRTFTREFKLAAVKLVTTQGYSYAEAAWKLDLRDNRIRRGKEELSAEGVPAFRGQGVLLLEDEVTRWRAENKRLTMERDILKKRRRSWPRSRWEVRLHPSTHAAISSAANG